VRRITQPILMAQDRAGRDFRMGFTFKETGAQTGIESHKQHIDFADIA
jgi:hypothetical protein